MTFLFNKPVIWLNSLLKISKIRCINSTKHSDTAAYSRLQATENVLFIAWNTVISPNFLVWKFCGEAQFPHSFERITRNYAETVSFHKIPILGIWVKLWHFSRWFSRARGFLWIYWSINFNWTYINGLLETIRNETSVFCEMFTRLSKAQSKWMFKFIHSCCLFLFIIVYYY